MERKPDPENNVPQSTEWGSDIVSKSTPKKRRSVMNSMDSKDEAIIQQFEECLEKSLEQKAAKSNLSTVAVKSLLKCVVTDENVLALLKHKEKGEDASEVIPFEPKITRSRAKALSNSGSSLFLPWDSNASNDSKVYQLLADDLHEESSDDEYVPATEESEDDSSFCCTPSNPPTPSTKEKNSIDDEGFKAPQLKTEKYGDDNHKSDEAANIALRTRSKLSLSDTPLEKIEQSFVPPDIPNDMMCELECNDDDWKNFLSSFAQPLDEVKNEEEDLDPEYNILSDEEITKVDTEELRDDRAVRVPKRELNDLIAELFEYVDIYEDRNDFQNDNLEINIDPESYSIQQLELDRYIEIFDGNSTRQIELNLEEDIPSSGHEPISDVCSEHSETEKPLSDLFSKIQHQLLMQQMSQHVQMLLQNFILTFNHPCYSEYAVEFKEFLLNFKLLSGDNDSSVFNTINLKGALTFMENWEKQFEEKSEETMETIKQFQEVMEESLDCFMNKKHYFLPFPESILKAISESEVFLYPQLLPKIPFKHPDLLNYNYAPFSTSEYQLVALGLEQFVQFLINDKEFSLGKKGINMMKIAEVIKKMLMPARKKFQIYRSISEMKNSKDWHNPIKFYFKNKRAPYTVHQVIDLNQFGILSPKQRPPDVLPRQWRAYIYKTPQDEEDDESLEKCSNPPLELKKPSVYKKILPKGEIPAETQVKKKQKASTTHYAYLKKRCENCFRRAIPYVEYSKLIKNFEFLNKFFPNQKFNTNSNQHDVLPSLPSLNIMSDVEKEGVKERGPMSLVKEETGKPVLCDPDEEQTNEIQEKRVARSTVENSRKDHSIVDEEKAKKREEFLASIATLAPPNLETDKERRRVFSLSFMDKLVETLGPDTIGQIMKLFSKGKLSNAVDSYMKMKPILPPENQDLADEFLLFLTAEQAHAVAQLTPFFIMNHTAKFLRYLELYSKDQTAQLVYRSLQNLNDTPAANLEKIEKAILPLLKSNPQLCDSFLRMFLEESSLDILLNGAWDVVEVNKKLNRAKEEGEFKNLVVTDEYPAFFQGMIYCPASMAMKPINTIPLLTVSVQRTDQNSNQLPSSPPKEDPENTETNIKLEQGRRRRVILCKSNKKSTPKQKTLCKLNKKSAPKPKTSEESPKENKNNRRKFASSERITRSNVETQKETISVTEANTLSCSSPKQTLENTQTNIELENGRELRVILCKLNEKSIPKPKISEESPKENKNDRKKFASSERITRSNVETQKETIPVTEENKLSSSPPEETLESTQTNIELEDGRKMSARLCKSNEKSIPKLKISEESCKANKNERRKLASSEIITQSNAETQKGTIPVTEENKLSSSPPDGILENVCYCFSNFYSFAIPITFSDSNQTQTNIELEDDRSRIAQLCKSNEKSTPKLKTSEESPKENKNKRRRLASSEIITQSNVETQKETIPVTEANKSSTSPPKEISENTQTNIELEDDRSRIAQLCKSNEKSTPKLKTSEKSPKENKNERRRLASSEIITQSNVETQKETIPVTEENKSSSSPPKEISKKTQTNIELEDGRKMSVRLCKSNEKSTPKLKTSEESPKENKNKRRILASAEITQSNVETQKETIPVPEANKSTSSPPEEILENTQTNIEAEDDRNMIGKLCKSNEKCTPKLKTSEESPKGNKNTRRRLASSEIMTQSNAETQKATIPVTEENKLSSSPPEEILENTLTNIELEDDRNRIAKLCNSNKKSTAKRKRRVESPEENKNKRRKLASSEIINQSNVEIQKETVPVTEANKSSSPLKGTLENTQTNIDLEDRERRVKLCKSNKKSTPEPKQSEESPKENKNNRRKLESSKIITRSRVETQKEAIPEADWKNLPSSKSTSKPLFDTGISSFRKSLSSIQIHIKDFLVMLPRLPSPESPDILTDIQKTDMDVGECGLMSMVNEVKKPVLCDSDKERTNEIPKKDTFDDTNALLVANSTVKNSRKDQSLVDKKKAKKRKEFLASIAMLAPSNPETEKERRQNLSIAYMYKLEETLGPNEFGKIMKIFSNERISNAVDLYMKLNPILLPKYKDLADEFLLFLTAEQACAVGQLIPFFIMNHMAKFLRYLELYFKDQPAQLRKVYKTLQDLNDTPEVNLEKIKNAILPLLKSNPLLCDSFLQMFLEESPPATLLNGAWDVIEVKELNRSKEEGAFENLTVTDEDPACSCSCHKIDGDQLQKHHCTNCGLKFIQGKLYCQTSKGMKPLNVSFPFNPDVDHITRLTVPSKVRRIDQNPNKSSSSPCKETLEDGKTYIELEDGRKRKMRLCKSNKKSTPKPKIFHCRDKSGESPKGNEEKLVCNKSPTRRKLANTKITTQSSAETHKETIPVTEADWKNLPSPEYIPLSDTDSSQEEEKTLNAINEETIKKDRADEKKSINEGLPHNWTKEEDRILLETFKQNFHKDPITLVKQRLKNRSEEEIRLRFDNLMNLLQEMYSRGDSQISNS
ncbi:uncharacterized protein LOC123307178 [Coccinella septempunctata]|uniref:uncharacterized protein LOC123307178 n=1 Tax=Coccinella septempunctata TaxID=41139 RepID=UPI001D08808C|nr:uncharacterized protein LOC123307178 [Coccinella septempunctata]